MKAFIVTNPTFSAFRAGEPIAFDLAQRAYRIEKKAHFKRWMAHDGHQVLVRAQGDIVYVELYEDDEPFSFEVMEVSADE